jgi:hypothetical protein
LRDAANGFFVIWPDRDVAVAREMKRLRADTSIIIFSAYQSLPGEVIGIADTWLRKEAEATLCQISFLRLRIVLRTRPFINSFEKSSDWDRDCFKFGTASNF